MLLTQDCEEGKKKARVVECKPDLALTRLLSVKDWGIDEIVKWIWMWLHGIIQCPWNQWLGYIDNNIDKHFIGIQHYALV